MQRLVLDGTARLRFGNSPVAGSLVVVALTLGLAGMAVACTGNRTSPPVPTVSPSHAFAPTVTRTVIFTPFAPSGSLATGLRVTLTTTGVCNGSNVLHRSNAYRCYLDKNEPNGVNVGDPCFSPAGAATFLICAADPVTPNVIKVTPRGGLALLDASGDPTSGTPWTVQLVSGQRCGFIAGATKDIDGLRLNYGCPDGGDLYGDPNKSHPLWTIRYGPHNSTSLSVVGIDLAWY